MSSCSREAVALPYGTMQTLGSTGTHLLLACQWLQDAINVFVEDDAVRTVFRGLKFFVESRDWLPGLNGLSTRQMLRCPTACFALDQFVIHPHAHDQSYSDLPEVQPDARSGLHLIFLRCKEVVDRRKQQGRPPNAGEGLKSPAALDLK